MSTVTCYAADGVAFRLMLNFENGADITSVDGCTLTAIAQNLLNKAEVSGEVTPDGDDALKVVFPPPKLAPGNWVVQVRVIPPAHAGLTLRNPVKVDVLPSFG